MHALAVTQAIGAPSQPKGTGPAKPSGGDTSFEDAMKAASRQPVEEKNAVAAEETETDVTEEQSAEATADAAATDENPEKADVTLFDVEPETDFENGGGEVEFAASLTPRAPADHSAKATVPLDRLGGNVDAPDPLTAPTLSDQARLAAQAPGSTAPSTEAVTDETSVALNMPKLAATPKLSDAMDPARIPVTPDTEISDANLDVTKAQPLVKSDIRLTTEQTAQAVMAPRVLSVSEMSNMNKTMAAAALTANPASEEKPAGFELKDLRSEREVSMVWPRQDRQTDITAAKIEIRPAQPMSSPTGLAVQLNTLEAAMQNAGADAAPDSLSFTETSRGRLEATQSMQSVMNIVQTRADLPANVARQIVEVVNRSADRSIELRLSPAELGHVRMKMSPADTGLVVSIVAERPETLDLMRRNIEQLERALEGIGYDDVSFSFETGTEASDTNADAETQNGKPRMLLDDEGNPDADTGDPENDVPRVHAPDLQRALDIRV